MSKNTIVNYALTLVYNQLARNTFFNKKHHALQFLSNTPYIRSDWDNSKTLKINKDTAFSKADYCLIGNVKLHKGYIFNVVDKDPTNGELIYNAKCSGFYYEELGQYKRL